MKRGLIGLLLATIVLALNSTLSADVVGYWKLDEGSGTVAYDSAGTHDGALIGNPTWDSAGYMGNCLVLDGTDDYVNVPDSDDLDFGADSSFTVSAWFKSTQTAGTRIVYKNDATNGYAIFLNVGSSGALSFRTWSGGTVKYALYAGSYNDNQWHFVVGVRDAAADQLRLYVDGILAATTAEGAGRNLANTQPLRFGTDYLGLYDFAGRLDDIRIYNQVLPADMIALMANEPGLVSQWKMDDKISSVNPTTAKDSRGGHDGSLVSGTWAYGRYGGGLYFDGNNDYVSVANHSDLNFSATADFSLSAWVKTSYTAYNQRIIYKKNASLDGYSLFVMATTGKVRLNIKGYGVSAFLADSTTTVADGKWHHILGVRDADANIKLYIDGSLQATTTTTGTNDLTNTAALYMGVDSSQNEDFYGSIDDIRVYNRALNSSRMAAMAAKKAVWYVDDSAPAGGNGGSWSSPFSSFSEQRCEWVACSGDEIRLGAGRYIADPCEITITGTLTIKGGYAGYGAGYPDARDIHAFETILDGDVTDNGPTADDKYRVLTFDGTGVVILDGLTVTGGYGSTNGGGIYSSGGTLTIRDCIFKENYASGSGGGIYCNTGILTVDQCRFEGNSSQAGEGGGIYATNNDPCDVLITNCLFVSNIGGGIRFVDVDGTIKACKFLGHTDSGYSGPGLRLDADDNYCSAQVIDCLFSGNVTTGNGGGICLYGVDETYGTSAYIVNCTFSGNTAGTSGGGLYIGDYAGVSVVNSILWGNSAGNYDQICDIGYVDVSYSDYQDGWSGNGTNNIDDDPLFVDADGADGILGTEDDDLRLLSTGSPCVDLGDPYGYYVGQTDLDGLDRAMDGDGNSTVVVDMGAYERWHDSNPGNSDNDGDGMLDEWEVRNGLNPDSYGADIDSDGDGLSDFREYRVGSDIFDPDSDDDGFGDWEEVVIFDTSPCYFDADNDFDGIPNIADLEPDNPNWGAPQISLTSIVQSPHTETAKMNVTVTLHVDNASKVTINNTEMTQDGETFTVNLVLYKGIQTLKVTARSPAKQISAIEYRYIVGRMEVVCPYAHTVGSDLVENSKYLFVQVLVDTAPDSMTVSVNGSPALNKSGQTLSSGDIITLGNLKMFWVKLTNYQAYALNTIRVQVDPGDIPYIPYAAGYSIDPDDISVGIKFTWNTNPAIATDYSDGDSDSDGIANAIDLWPFDNTESADNDNDGIGNTDDPDDGDPTIQGAITITGPGNLVSDTHSTTANPAWLGVINPALERQITITGTVGDGSDLVKVFLTPSNSSGCEREFTVAVTSGQWEQSVRLFPGPNIIEAFSETGSVTRVIFMDVAPVLIRVEMWWHITHSDYFGIYGGFTHSNGSTVIPMPDPAVQAIQHTSIGTDLCYVLAYERYEIPNGAGQHTIRLSGPESQYWDETHTNQPCYGFYSIVVCTPFEYSIYSTAGIAQPGSIKPLCTVVTHCGGDCGGYRVSTLEGGPSIWGPGYKDMVESQGAMLGMSSDFVYPRTIDSSMRYTYESGYWTDRYRCVGLLGPNGSSSVHMAANKAAQFWALADYYGGGDCDEPDVHFRIDTAGVSGRFTNYYGDALGASQFPAGQWQVDVMNSITYSQWESGWYPHTYPCETNATAPITVYSYDADLDMSLNDKIEDIAVPGAIVVRNDDDDNYNGQPDRLDLGPNTQIDDDLMPLNLSAPGPDVHFGTLRLEALVGGSSIRVWTDRYKTSQVTLPIEWTLLNQTHPSVLYVEGIGSGSSIRLMLSHSGSGGTTIANDIVNITVP